MLDMLDMVDTAFYTAMHSCLASHCSVPAMTSSVRSEMGLNSSPGKPELGLKSCCETDPSPLPMVQSALAGCLPANHVHNG